MNRRRMAYASTLKDAPVENGKRQPDEFYKESELVMRACKDKILNGSVEVGLPPEHHVYRIVETTTREEAEMRQELESACEELNLTPTEFNAIIVRVWYSLFSDGINWGRIVAFLAFCQHLCAYSKRNGLHFAIESIPPWVAMFVDSELKEWILSHGGWANFPRPRQAVPQKRLAVAERTGAWEQGFRGIALGLNLLNALSVR